MDKKTARALLDRFIARGSKDFVNVQAPSGHTQTLRVALDAHVNLFGPGIDDQFILSDANQGKNRADGMCGRSFMCPAD